LAWSGPRVSEKSTDSVWEWFGKHDPYFGVVSHERFRQAAQSGDMRAEFFRSGELHAERVMAAVSDLYQVSPRTAVDFGCGVGRVTIPLAKRVNRVVGMDVSPAMLEVARRNSAEAGVANIDWVVSDDSLAHLQGDFELIHSFIVLQHIPVRRGLAIVPRLLDHLAPGGVAVLQFTYWDSSPGWRRVLRGMRKRIFGVHRLLEMLRGRAPQPFMQMNLYPLNSLFAALQRHGCHRVAVRFSDHFGHLGVVLFAQRAEETTY
jgi:SAM-dependent methyltransferase